MKKLGMAVVAGLVLTAGVVFTASKSDSDVLREVKDRQEIEDLCRRPCRGGRGGSIRGGSMRGSGRVLAQRGQGLVDLTK